MRWTKNCGLSVADFWGFDTIWWRLIQASKTTMPKKALILLHTLAILFCSTSGFCAVHVQGYQGEDAQSVAYSKECRWRMSGGVFNRLPETTRLGLVAPCSGSQIWIQGEISRSDGADFAALVSFFESADFVAQPRESGEIFWPSIILDSEGGSVLAALEIAKEMRASAWIRDSSLTATADVCYSACVLILAASYSRIVGGDVGIHRPYFLGEEYRDWGYEDLQDAYEALYTELARSFSRWNLPMSLVDDMFSVPSSEIRVLTATELARYGLDREDLVKQELRLAEMRTICGKVFDQMISGEGRTCLDRINAARHDRTVAEYTSRLCGKVLTSDELNLPDNIACRDTIRQSNGFEPVN